MKPSYHLVLAIGIGALMLQGCASSGTTRPAGASSAQSAAASAIRNDPSRNALPEVNGKPVVKADTKDNFEAIVAAIHKQMQPGGRWQYTDEKERAIIDGNFADMAQLYQKFGSVDKMNKVAKARLFNDQSSVNAILTKRDGDRMICQSVRPVGSHLPVEHCKTYAEMQAERDHAQELLREIAPTPQTRH